MEQYEQLLHDAANGKSPGGRSLLPEIPALNWPGKPGVLDITRPLSPAEIDSLEAVISKQ
jgi:hypothetical protein